MRGSSCALAISKRSACRELTCKREERFRCGRRGTTGAMLFSSLSPLTLKTGGGLLRAVVLVVTALMALLRGCGCGACA